MGVTSEGGHKDSPRTVTQIKNAKLGKTKISVVKTMLHNKVIGIYFSYPSTEMHAHS